MKELQLKLKRTEEENRKLKEAEKASSEEGGDNYTVLLLKEQTGLIFIFILRDNILSWSICWY